MGLNESKGNMYEFITHTWNTVKGSCPHNCLYCYMKRWGELKAPRFDEKELNTDLGSGNFIFVGSSNDMFAKGVPVEWIIKTLDHCKKFDNKYFFQSKNPARMVLYEKYMPAEHSLCTTIESNLHFTPIMGEAPYPRQRAYDLSLASADKYITIEPIMEFTSGIIDMIKNVKPVQVNVGADSGKNGLPEPGPAEVAWLIAELQKFTRVNIKRNLHRILEAGAVSPKVKKFIRGQE